MTMEHVRSAATQTIPGADSTGQTPTRTTRRRAAPASTPTVASVLGEGAAQALAERVTDYLEPAQALLLRVRAWYDVDCRQLDELAHWCLAGTPRPAKAAGDPVTRLPVGTPQFHRMVIGRVAARLAPAGADDGQALARAVRAVGIFQCLVRDVPVERCTCLAAVGRTLSAPLHERVGELLEAIRRDLRPTGAELTAGQFG
jgi:hypothetical protein